MSPRSISMSEPSARRWRLPFTVAMPLPRKLHIATDQRRNAKFSGPPSASPGGKTISAAWELGLARTTRNPLSNCRFFRFIHLSRRCKNRQTVVARKIGQRNGITVSHGGRYYLKLNSCFRDSSFLSLLRARRTRLSLSRVKGKRQGERKTNNIRAGYQSQAATTIESTKKRCCQFEVVDEATVFLILIFLRNTQ